MQRVLSFEQTPPIAVPLRFFLTAPMFVLAAAALLLWHGEAALTSRWSGPVLAITHLFTLGFLGLCMIGAVLQILPVIAGVEVPKPRLTAGWTHGLLTAGTALLACGFLFTERWLFGGALLLLGAAFGVFLCACWLGLRGLESSNTTLNAVRLALLALAATVMLGLALASAFAWTLSLPLPLPALTDLHAAWGLGGWIGLLVVAVAFQVVPMFQVTEIYPRHATRWFAPGVFTALCVLSVGAAFTAPASGVPQFAAGGAALIFIAFGAVTWRLIRRRKRPKPEPTTYFWYASAASLIAACLLFVLAQLYPALRNQAAYPLALGVLFLIGFAYSVVNGMLYKIVPFLVWYHLQDRLFDSGVKAPNVRQVISEAAARGQLLAHVIALLAFLAATIWPDRLARLAGAGLLISSLWLWINLLAAARVYRSVLAKAEAPHA